MSKQILNYSKVLPKQIIIIVHQGLKITGSQFNIIQRFLNKDYSTRENCYTCNEIPINSKKEENLKAFKKSLFHMLINNNSFSLQEF